MALDSNYSFKALVAGMAALFATQTEAQTVQPNVSVCYWARTSAGTGQRATILLTGEKVDTLNIGPLGNHAKAPVMNFNPSSKRTMKISVTGQHQRGGGWTNSKPPLRVYTKTGPTIMFPFEDGHDND